MTVLAHDFCTKAATDAWMSVSNIPTIPKKVPLKLAITIKRGNASHQQYQVPQQRKYFVDYVVVMQGFGATWTHLCYALCSCPSLFLDRFAIVVTPHVFGLS